MRGKWLLAACALVGLGFVSGRAAEEAIEAPVEIAIDVADAPAAPLAAAAAAGSAGSAVEPEDQAAPEQGVHPFPAQRFHARPAEEWQGMRVDLSMMPACQTTAQCGLAMACQDGRCGPCSADADCGKGEACVLDHCVEAERVSCRTHRDCASGELCVLSGYAVGARGNAGMRAYCNAPAGGKEID